MKSFLIIAPMRKPREIQSRNCWSTQSSPSVRFPLFVKFNYATQPSHNGSRRMSVSGGFGDFPLRRPPAFLRLRLFLSAEIGIFQLRNDIAFLPSNWGNLFTQSHERFHNIFGRIPLASNYAFPWTTRGLFRSLSYFVKPFDSSFSSIWFRDYVGETIWWTP